MISGHSIFTGFCGLTGCQWDPWDRGVTTWYQSLGTRIPRTRWGTSLDHSFIVHFDELMCDVCLNCMKYINEKWYMEH